MAVEGCNAAFHAREDLVSLAAIRLGLDYDLVGNVLLLTEDEAIRNVTELDAELWVTAVAILSSLDLFDSACDCYFLHSKNSVVVVRVPRTLMVFKMNCNTFGIKNLSMREIDCRI